MRNLLIFEVSAEELYWEELNSLFHFHSISYEELSRGKK